jgi:hexokinase
MTVKFENLKITIDVNMVGNDKLGTQLASQYSVQHWATLAL